MSTRPPSAVIAPVIHPPLIRRWPRTMRKFVIPERLGGGHGDPSADRTPRARTRNVYQVLYMTKAAAKIGASVETETSISPTRPGYATWRRRRRRPLVVLLRLSSAAVQDLLLEMLSDPLRRRAAGLSRENRAANER